MGIVNNWLLTCKSGTTHHLWTKCLIYFQSQHFFLNFALQFKTSTNDVHWTAHIRDQNMSMMLIYDMGISIIIHNPKIFIRKYNNWSRINKDENNHYQKSVPTMHKFALRKININLWLLHPFIVTLSINTIMTDTTGFSPVNRSLI
jgi:hypothetical protein